MIQMNPFANRQTKESRFSLYSGTEQQLCLLVRDHFDKGVQSYREGILEVPVPAEGFFSGMVMLQEGDKLEGGFDSRRKGETPRKWVAVPGSRKMPAKSVKIIVYSSVVLAESGDNTLPAEDGNWEIVSINASCVEGKEPINPETLMANHFGADGGTNTKMSDSEFVAALKESYDFWNNKAMCGGEK